MPDVVNRKHYLPVPGWGAPTPVSPRARRPAMPSDAVYIGRGTPLGNPFRVRVFGAASCLGLYRQWLAIGLGMTTLESALARTRNHAAREILHAALPNDPAILRQLRSIGPGTLIVCSCNSKPPRPPKPCHGFTVLNAWQWLKHTGQL